MVYVLTVYEPVIAKYIGIIIITSQALPTPSSAEMAISIHAYH